LNATHSDDVVATRDNQVEIPARMLLSVGARYRFNFGQNAATLRAQVTNLTDEYGWELRGSGAYDFIAGRVASVGIAADF